MRRIAPFLLLLSACGEEQRAAEAHPLLSDPRIAPLLDACPKSGYYDQFVDDMVPVLIEKLQVAGGDPLQRAKEELGAMGTPAAQEIRRLVDQSFTNAFLGAHLENALDAASMNETPVAHDVLLRALDHPMESVRQRAMLGMLARHATPADYDLFRFRVDGTEPIEMRRLYLRGMFAADRARAEADTLAWFGTRTNQTFWLEVCAEIGRSRSAEIGRRCAELFADFEPTQAAWLAAPAVRAGDEQALAFLLSELEAESPNQRLNAVRALTAAGRIDLLERPATEDPDPNVRVFAIDGIVKDRPPTAEELGWIRDSLTADAEVVRGHALQVLCEHGDPSALDQALAGLGQSVRILGPALRALQKPLEAPALSERAFELLMERHALEEHRPLQERTATYKAVGLVQLPEAAAFLRGIALASERERIEGLRAHEWLMIQASNTGPEGRAWLWSELERETDPSRRIDLLGAVCSTHDHEERAQVRELLLGLCERGAASGFELVWAADRAAKIGPAVIVAPRLKLVTQRLDEPRIQVAMQCLLWRWY